nr:MAG TPA: hypothetical protein [Caudoviricetes sp.]
MITLRIYFFIYFAFPLFIDKVTKCPILIKSSIIINKATIIIKSFFIYIRLYFWSFYNYKFRFHFLEV